jgi:hypothetical protein
MGFKVRIMGRYISPWEKIIFHRLGKKMQSWMGASLENIYMDLLFGRTQVKETHS